MPTLKRNPNKLNKVFCGNVIPKFKIAARKAQTKNTFDGENLSATLNMANKSVPVIKPNCIAEVNILKALAGKPNDTIIGLITALLANHNEVQQN